MSEQGNSGNVTLSTREDGISVDVAIGGVPFTSYVSPDIVKKPVLYPLRTATGTVVTRGFPLEPRPGEDHDHPHQVGLWLTYGDVNGLDFWGNREEIPESDRHKYGRIRHKSINSAEGNTLDVTMEWLAPDGTALFREDTRYVFSGTETRRGIDRLATLTAGGGDVQLPDTKEGMLGIRLAKELEQPSGDVENDPRTGWYRNSEGLEGDDVWGKRANWVKLTGRLGGEQVSVSILDHSANPVHPTYWHARGYGLFAVNPFGVKDFTGGETTLDFSVPSGQSITFRHRILIDAGNAPSDDALNAEFAAFCGE